MCCFLFSSLQPLLYTLPILFCSYSSPVVRSLPLPLHHHIYINNIWSFVPIYILFPSLTTFLPSLFLIFPSFIPSRFLTASYCLSSLFYSIFSALITSLVPYSYTSNTSAFPIAQPRPPFPSSSPDSLFRVSLYWPMPSTDTDPLLSYIIVTEIEFIYFHRLLCSIISELRIIVAA